MRLDETKRAAAVECIVQAMGDGVDGWDCGRSITQMFGWDGGMSPITRVAFVRAYGETLTAELEAEARAKVDGMKRLKTDGAFARHMANAAETAARPVSEWKAGDFVVALDIGLKFDHGNIHDHIWDFVEGEDADARHDDPDGYVHVKERLCKITRVVDKPAGFFDSEAALLDYKPEEGDGGFDSDDIPEGMTLEDVSNLPKAERNAVYDTFYSLCVLVRAASGEYVLIDSEGYSYARYALLPKDYRAMYAATIERIRERKERERQEEEAKAREEQAKAKAAYEARCAAWAPFMKPVSDNEGCMAVKGNILAMARHAFPGVRFTCRKPHGWWCGYTLTWKGGPSAEEVKAKTDFDLFKGCWDTFDGMTDLASTARAEFTGFAERYGWASNGVELHWFAE